MPCDDKCYSEKKVEQCGTEWLGNWKVRSVGGDDIYTDTSTVRSSQPCDYIQKAHARPVGRPWSKLVEEQKEDCVARVQATEEWQRRPEGE